MKILKELKELNTTLSGISTHEEYFSSCKNIRTTTILEIVSVECGTLDYHIVKINTYVRVDSLDWEDNFKYNCSWDGCATVMLYKKGQISIETCPNTNKEDILALLKKAKLI